MKIKYNYFIIILFTNSQILFGQSKLDSIPINNVDSTLILKEYTSLEEALKNPELVYRLNLSNKKLMMPYENWTKFKNLQYLSLKNEHLKVIPSEIAFLRNLKILDLSGNDFQILPKSFSNLTNLEELFLNDEKYIKIDSAIKTLSLLPNLKILHLENDHLKRLPKNINSLTHLEMLYLNNNDFNSIPTEIKGLKNLRYLDIHDNRITPNSYQNIQNQNFGVKINF